MKGHNKLWSIVGFVLVVLAILAGTYVSVIGVGAKHQGSAKNIKLGLDLAGGVSITYEVNESNPSAEDMRDTVYKLQQRVSVYSTEAEVYQKAPTGSMWRSPAFIMLRKCWKLWEIPGQSSFMRHPQTVTQG